MLSLHHRSAQMAQMAQVAQMAQMAQMAQTSRRSRGAAERTSRRGTYLTENAVATKKNLAIGVASKDTSRMFAIMRHISHPSEPPK